MKDIDIEEEICEKIFDQETGICISEITSLGQDIHKENSPAWIERDRHSGVVTYEAWYLKGNLHRTNGPAVIERVAESGVVKSVEWWRNGTKVPAQNTPKPTF